MSETTDPGVDEWDGKLHKVMICVGCIVSGLGYSASHVVTACDKYFADPFDWVSKLRCQVCVEADDPDICGVCGGVVNKEWS